MRYLSFRILAICILYPPVLFLFGTQFAASHLIQYYKQQVEQIAVGDVQPLFAGSETIEAVVPDNIQRFLKHQRLVSWAVKLKITVTSRRGHILFPPPYNEFDPKLSPKDPIEVAAKNYETIKEGLNVSVEADLSRLASSAFLAVLILSSMVTLFVHLSVGAAKAQKDDLKRSDELHRLEKLKNDSKRQLLLLEQEHQSLNSEFAAAREDLEKERKKANRNEDQFIQEIENLEDKLQENTVLQQEQLGQIEELKAQIDAFEKEQDRLRRLQEKAADYAKKRFQTLYKRLSFHSRAIEDFVDLPEELKLKAEETILLLNENADQVTIKRKVFSKKSQEAVLEVAFGYRGRLYFRRQKNGQIELLALGTKNSQAKNLEFINKL